MSGPAHVRSSDAIEAFNLALAAFADRVQNALDSLDADMRRSDDWIDHNRPTHWRNQVRQAEDAVHDAKMELERALLMTTADGQRPSCREQKAAVAQAKRHLDYCREKMEIVQKWQRNFRHESTEFRGRLGQLRRVIEQDVPESRALLERIVEHLERYQLERAPDALAAHPQPADASLENYVRQVAPDPGSAAPGAPSELGTNP